MFSRSQKSNNRLFLGAMVTVTCLAIYTVGAPALWPSQSDLDRTNALRNQNAKFQMEMARERRSEEEKQQQQQQRGKEGQ
ncbi:hypothetical protein HDU98_005662 [Podochytrium sp. JEL0797]|nr:hypothetical protein HDU98_005662 [Podochytrium sp. JEL0797]